jgi:hypothetical protein
MNQSRVVSERPLRLQRLVEWSDNHTVAKSLRRKGSTMERLVTSLGEAL